MILMDGWIVGSTRRQQIPCGNDSKKSKGKGKGESVTAF
jgi:hypothetical protein